MDSSVLPKDEIWFLRVCHHISNAVYRNFSFLFNLNWLMAERPVYPLILFMSSPRLELRNLAGYSVIINPRTLWAQAGHTTGVVK